MYCKKYNNTYDFELPITREGRAFSTRSINSNTIKPMILSQVMGFFYSFLNWSLMPDLSGLLSSVTRINRFNVTTKIPFNSILSFQGKNLDEFQMIPETVSWFSNP